jgi:hypothetical protein
MAGKKPRASFKIFSLKKRHKKVLHEVCKVKFCVRNAVNIIYQVSFTQYIHSIGAVSFSKKYLIFFIFLLFV